MASLGHVAVGLAAARLHAGGARPRAAAVLVFTALACFPDLDAFARALGAARGSVWLHRGALHALVVAAGAGVAAAALGGLGRSRPRMAAAGTLVAASHGLLDTLFTQGAQGVMLLWPFETARLLAPWRALPAAPIGLHLASARGLAVLIDEAVLFSPLLVYALWPRRRATPEGGAPAGAG